MDRFRDATPLLGDPDALRRRLDEDSCLFFRQLLPAGDIAAVRSDVVAALDRCGWIEPGTGPMEARPTPRACRESGDAVFLEAYIAIQSLQSFNELAHHPELLAVVRQVLGDDAFAYPGKIVRVTVPDPEWLTPPHQDYRLVQGNGDVLTSWIPLGDCPEELGGLSVLRGSHRSGVKQVQQMFGVGSLGVEARDDDPQWATADYLAGDVLIFHSFSVHSARPNRTDRLRLSVDYRFQSASDPIADSNVLPHRYPEVPSFEELTKGWTSLHSISYPENVRIVSRFDPFDPDVETPPSRLVSTEG